MKLGPETVHMYLHQNLFSINCRLPKYRKAFLQLQHHTELLANQ